MTTMPIHMLLAALAACFFSAGEARAQAIQSPVLAIQAQAPDDALLPVAEIVEQVVRADLLRSGRAAPGPAPDGALRSVSTLPDFAALAAAGARLALVIEVSHASHNRERTAFRLYDVASRAQVSAFEYITVSDNRRRIAHRIADRVLMALGGAAEFDSRITAVRGRGADAQVVVLDSDGANYMAITAPGAYAAPRFAIRDMIGHRQARR